MQVDKNEKIKKWWHLRKVRFTLLVMILGLWAYREYRIIDAEPATSWQKDSYGDCAIVLTGGAGRVREGISLLTRKMVRKLVISGVHPNVELSELFSAWPFVSGWSEQDIVLERRSTTTFGNAQQSYPIVEALGCRDIVLVTSELHMYRASKTFFAVFPKNINMTKHTLPSSVGESNFLEISTEVMKSMFYSLWAY